MSELLRVATFNVRHGAKPNGRVSFGAMAAACAALDADVLGLQEVDRRRWRSRMRDSAAYVAARLSARHVFGVARRRGLIGAYGNALLARGELDDVEVQPLPGTGERQPRVAILARVQIGSIALSVAVAHLQHFPAHLRHLPDEAPEQLEAVLAALRARPSPRVLLGDLNLQEPRAAPLLTSAGFTPAVTGPTFPADAPRIRLDWIAVDGLVVERAHVSARTAVSDHRPVVAEVRVAGSIR
jgi:endonuclease/exonuclease/phosphatase family metal-dependent hydrolase